MRRIWMLCALVLPLTVSVSTAEAVTHGAKSHGPRWTRAVKHHQKAKRETRHGTKLQTTAASAATASVAGAAAGNDPVLFGDQNVEAGLDSNTAGLAEAFPFTGTTTGSAQSITVYVDSHSRAGTLIAGLYSDHNGHPGTLLASGTNTSPASGGWNTVGIASTAVTSGTKYWVTLLGTGGTVYFRDRSNGSCRSENSAQTSLTALPSAWTTGRTWNTCPVSAYVSGTVPVSQVHQPGGTQTIPDLLAPTNTAPPVVSGNPTQGQTLTTTNGSWANLPTSYAYAWQDCDTAGNSCTTISGATTSSYTLTAADAGHTIRSVVTASNLLGSGTASSNPTATVAPLPPANTAAPAVTGTARQGQALTTTNGTWSNSPTSYKYAWQDCDSSGNNCTTVSGASSSSYTLAAGDVGHTIRSVVTATNAGGSGSATSAQTAVVTAAPPPTPPSNSAPPAVTGTAKQGQALTTTNGTWSNSPTSYKYAWQDCDSSGNNCANISGASSSSYTLGAGDVGHTIRSVVAATNAGGSGSATSAQTAVVAAGSPPANTNTPTVSGQAVQGQTLASDTGTWSGSPSSFSYQWQDCNSTGGSCTSISGANVATYTLTSNDVGHTIRSVVTAGNAYGSTAASSAATAVVTASSSPPPPPSGLVPCPLTHAAGAGANSCWATHTGVQGSTGFTEAQIEANPAAAGFTIHNGDLVITSPNTVIDHVWIKGCIQIADGADNSVVKNSLVTPNGDACSGDNAGGSAINTGQGSKIAKNTLIEDVTIDGGNPGYGSHTAGITLDGGKALRVNLFGFAQGFISDTNTAQYPALFQDDYGHDYNGCSHDDGTWFNSSSYVTFEHGWIMTNDPTQQGSAGCSTGALTGGSDYGPQDHVVFDNSYGEGVTGEDTHAGCGSTYSAYTNNALSTNMKDYGSGFVQTGTGNKWSGNYAVDNNGNNVGTVADPQGANCPG